MLALQGCVEPHVRHLNSLGATVKEVRLPADLAGIEGLVLPGGESTTMLKLANQFSLWDPLKESAAKVPFWGICAGSILMAREVENPAQSSLGVMDIVVRRNAYGRQIDSFQEDVHLSSGEVQPAAFIRAPMFLSWGPAVSVLGTVRGDSTFLSQGHHMVTAFHPELSSSHWCHELFLKRLK
ncbi:MAG: pyridoxal 5'-phosphate synthase glutaminase subunit PdxT [Proteobacteria bacterium]|nr:MAG: pyridoxal 5'-phosphate synthase glutaminase subunit PdxT [Pseudomonadota bacterium]